jgi:Ca2+-binding EF-hand superfamily protein
MARVFTLYDADGDGVISRSELRDVVMAIHRLSPHGKINDKDSIRIRGEGKKEKERKVPGIVSPRS